MVPLAPLDVRLFFDVYAGGGGALTVVAHALSAVGNGWVMFGLIPLYAMAGWRRFALYLAGVLAGSATLVVVLKWIVGRPRPCAVLPGVHALCAMPTDPSFPSGHACGSFTFAAFVVLATCTGDTLPLATRTRVLVVLAVVFLATGIAWSRVYLGVHYPADVAAGALLGTASGALAGWRYQRGVAAPSA